MEIEIFGIGIAVFTEQTRQLFMTEFGITVLPWQLFIMLEFGMCHFTWQFVTVVRYLSYLAPSRGAVCDTAVIDNDTGLRRIGVYIV